MMARIFRVISGTLALNFGLSHFCRRSTILRNETRSPGTSRTRGRTCHEAPATLLKLEFHEFENLLAVSEIGKTIGKLEALASELGVLFVNRDLENVF